MRAITVAFIGLCLLCNFLNLENAVGSQQRNSNNNLYWLSFSRSLQNTADGPRTRFIMQIDSLGRVTIQPKKIVSPSNFASSTTSTAITNAGTKLINLWMTDDSGSIFRAEIDNQSLKM